MGLSRKAFTANPNNPICALRSPCFFMGDLRGPPSENSNLYFHCQSCGNIDLSALLVLYSLNIRRTTQLKNYSVGERLRSPQGHHRCSSKTQGNSKTRTHGSYRALGFSPPQQLRIKTSTLKRTLPFSKERLTRIDCFSLVSLFYQTTHFSQTRKFASARDDTDAEPVIYQPLAIGIHIAQCKVMYL